MAPENLTRRVGEIAEMLRTMEEVDEPSNPCYSLTEFQESSGTHDVASRKFGSLRVNELTHTLTLTTNRNKVH